MNAPPNLVFAYIDETGDRGFSPASSEWFALTALVIAAEHDYHQRAIVEGLRKVVVQTTKALHYTEHFKAKRPERREQAAQLLATIPGQVITVMTHKPCVDPNLRLASDGVTFYNYSYRLLMERIAYTAANWPGGARQVKVCADSVKGMDHAGTVNYLDLIRRNGPAFSQYPVPWQTIVWPPVFRDSGSTLGLQAADLFSGTLGTALMRGDDRWLTPWMHRIRMAGSPAVWGRGVKVISNCHTTCLVTTGWGKALQQKLSP